MRSEAQWRASRVGQVGARELTAGSAPRPTAAPDLIGCLSYAVAASNKQPKIVTFSRAIMRAENLMTHVFGPGATANLIVRSATVPGAAVDFSGPNGDPASPLDFDPATYAVLARFRDPGVLELVAAHHGAWLERAAAIIVSFDPEKMRGWNPSDAGFPDARVFSGPMGGELTVFLRPPKMPPGLRDGPALGDRPAMARLVVVDPCLDGLRGHYLPYATRLTEGARARGVEVIWGCHRQLNGDSVPTGIEVRRCFTRSFFDIPLSDLPTIEFSLELLKGWLELCDEFDGVGNHFLVHSADAYLLRAAARLLRRRPRMRSTIHFSFSADPRQLVDRTPGADVFQVIQELRRAPAWERSLFFWAENQRLSRWLSKWLRAPIPILPMLAPPGPGAEIWERKPEDKLVVSVLGRSRPEKGFQTLPQIFDQISAAPSLRSALKIVIQDWAPRRGDIRQHERAVARFRSHPFVEVVNGMLDADAYARRLEESDVLLLPYNPQFYALRSSGILVEGLARGAIIITREGTAFEDAAKDGVVLTYSTVEGLMDVLHSLLDSLDETLSRARWMAVCFQGSNAPKRYVAALAARATSRAQT